MCGQKRASLLSFVLRCGIQKLQRAPIGFYRPYRLLSTPIDPIGTIGTYLLYQLNRPYPLPFPYVLPSFPSASQDFRQCIISLRLHYCVELAAPAGFAKPPSQHHGRSRDDKVCYRATRRCHGFQSRCPSLSNWFDRPIGPTHPKRWAHALYSARRWPLFVSVLVDGDAARASRGSPQPQHESWNVAMTVEIHVAFNNDMWWAMPHELKRNT